MCSGRWDKPCRLTKPPTFSLGHSGDDATRRERGVVTTSGILLAPDLTATVKLGVPSSAASPFQPPASKRLPVLSRIAYACFRLLISVPFHSPLQREVSA